MKRIPPLHIRRLRAAMALKNLTQLDVSRLCGLPMGSVNAILTGQETKPARIDQVKTAIRKAPMPEEAAA